VTDPPIPTAPLTAAASGPALEELLAAAVAGCADVVGLSEGPFGEVATHLAGRRVPGIRLHEDRVEVHVIVRWGVRLPELSDRVRAACAPLAGGRPVDVAIDDLAPEEAGGSLPAAELASASPAAPGTT